MTDTLALLAVAALGYFMILDFEPNHWFRNTVESWCDFARSAGVSNPILAWLVCVALPATVVGALAALLKEGILNFLVDAVVLGVTTAVGSFMRYHRSLLKAVYANDRKLASEYANRWGRREVEVVDGKDRFVPRMLGLCALRLHEDVLAIVLWFLVLGPGGAVLAAAHQVFVGKVAPGNRHMRFVNAVGERVSLVLFGVVGNMRPALVPAGTSFGDAVMETAGFGGKSVDIERVQGFGNNLMHAFFLCVGGAVVIMLMFMA